MPPRMRRRITSARREQIETEQKQLSQAIVRPFDVVSGMPVSYNSPPHGHYEDVLKMPLTIKDTGVLYRSLMKSRFTYVFLCPMFRLYWVKQSSYAKKLAEQDKPIPKTLRDDILNDREPILSLDLSARDVMVKLCDASLTLGPHSFEIRLFIAKDERSEKKNKDKEKDKETKDQKDTPQNPSPLSSTTVPAKPLGSFNSSNTTSSTTGLATSAPASTPKPPIPTSTPPSIGVSSTPKPPSFLLSGSSASRPGGFQPTTTQPPTSTLNRSAPSTPTTSAVKPSLQLGASSSTTTTPKPPTTAPSSTPAPAPKSDLTNMQSIENTIMISNLNAIARQDESLNKLMKIVALGSASPQQIVTFQGYIKRAREMGPQPHHAYLFQLNTTDSNGYRRPLKEKKERKPEVPRDQKLTAFQEKYVNNATLIFEYVENANVRFMLPKDAIIEVLSPKLIKKDDGTEEEDDNRDMIVSFIWVHNWKEVEVYEQKLKLYNEKVKEREEEERKKEEEKKKEEEQRQKEEEERIAAANAEAETEKTKSDETEATTSKKKPPARKAAPKKLEKPIEPEVKFTPMSFTVHGIPSKYVPIFVNSVPPLEKAQEKMTTILNTGTRIASFHLWYQVDGKLDEKLAEEVRSQLVQEEKKMTGVTGGDKIAALAAKKRKL
ncbi:uncharacterized protein CANTADRAFT_36918, partial [Suhomyces tanzawaensis NRRL Y-17324]